MSYIVKNCPCYVEGRTIKGNEQKTQTCNNHKVRELILCQDCTDCVIKQAIEMCNIYKNFIAVTISDYAKRELAFHILDLFDIEEINK